MQLLSTLMLAHFNWHHILRVVQAWHSTAIAHSFGRGFHFQDYSVWSFLLVCSHATGRCRLQCHCANNANLINVRRTISSRRNAAPRATGTTLKIAGNAPSRVRFLVDGEKSHGTLVAKHWSNAFTTLQVRPPFRRLGRVWGYVTWIGVLMSPWSRKRPWNYVCDLSGSLTSP